MPRTRAALLVLALAAATAGGVVTATNEVRPTTAAVTVISVLVGWAFAASGFVAWRVRPENRIGPAMVLTSFLWSLWLLYWSQDPFVFAIGHVASAMYLSVIVYILLAFPTGRLDGRLPQGVAAAAFLVTGPAELLYTLVGGHMHGGCDGCPPMVLQVVDARELAAAITSMQHTAGLVLGALTIGVLVHRWRTASAALRFAIAPVVWTGAALMIVLLVWVIDQAIDVTAGRVIDVALYVMLIALALSFLAGVARTRLARSAVADLMLDLSGVLAPGGLRAALARALRDPSLEVVYWLPATARYVDARGEPVDLPHDEAGRALTVVERDGRRIAALVHDPALEDEQLLRSACAAAALAIENERLQAELRAQLVEVRSSRARIVEAAQGERRRIERDLHDGTQQRLVSVAMTLGLAEARAASDAAGARELIAESRAALSATLAELRELSRGIHPGILTERGLAHALDDLVSRLRLPVDLEVALDERLPAAIETTAYYVVSEGLTNVAKYAHATSARVRVARQNGAALVEVSDDGAGGADPLKGSGLRGLRDRVEAIGGRFAVTSAAGRGTTIRAELPCG